MFIALIGRKTGQTDSVHSDLNKLLFNFASTAYRRGHIVMVDTDTEANFFKRSEGELPNIIFKPLDKIAETADIVIVFGGDGTMLHTAKALSMNNVPILGVNLGRLGFISDVPNDFPHEDLISMIERKEYDIEVRNMLFVSTHRTDSNLNKLALNEIVISRSTGKVIEFDVFIDKEFAYRARGDGLMISTPTGSTAYALSAGGSIIHPSARVLEIIPIFPQTLSCRPLIVPDEVDIEFKLISGEATVFIDGIEETRMNVQTVHSAISIKKASSKIKFVHPQTDNLSYSYYHTLREKLNWQHQPGTPK